MNKRCTILPILLGRQGGFPLREENKWRSFLLAFTLTLMLLAFIMVLTVMAVQPSMPRQNSRDDPPEISYRPVAGDALTMVVVGRSQDGSAGDFHPQYGQVPLAMLPPETLVTLGGERLTLSEAWERGGGVSVREALSERLGITVDRYAALSRDIFIRIAQKTGTVVFTLPYAISYEPDGYSINIPAGERRLDAQDVADVFSCPVFEGGALGKSELLGDLAAAIVNQTAEPARRIDLNVSASYDDAADTVRAVLTQAAAAHEKVLKDRPIEAHVTGYGDSAVNYVLRFWARTEDYWTCYNDVLDGLQAAFSSAGVTMTYPHINVHMES
mgnify:CR=1 FL=1